MQCSYKSSSCEQQSAELSVGGYQYTHTYKRRYTHKYKCKQECNYMQEQVQVIQLKPAEQWGGDIRYKHT